jgi:hypothetical protein
MNERIFKLALKAMDFQGAVDTDTELKMTNDELAKFAELIVSKCVEQSLKVSHRNDDMGSIIANMIKQHFGVEQ